MNARPELICLPENTQGCDWVVGDIHGCVGALFEKLDEVGFNFDVDRLLSVGDLIDRGPQSYDALHLLYLTPGLDRQWFYAVRGNHEVLMLDALLGQDMGCMRTWLGNGGSWILDEDFDELRMIARDQVAEMPLAMEVPVNGYRLGVVHADVTSGRWGEFSAARDIWSRERFRACPEEGYPLPGRVQGVDAVAVGHTIRPEVDVRDNVVHLDTGAFLKKGTLTVLPAGDVVAKAINTQSA